MHQPRKPAADANPAPPFGESITRHLPPMMLLEAAPDAMVIVNRNGIIELVNSRTEQMFGYRREELVGQPVEILVPESLRTAHTRHRSDYAKAPKNRSIDSGQTLSARRKDGSEFPAEIGISPLQTDNGPLVISSIRDVTERVHSQQTIEQLNAGLENRVNQRTAALRKANEELQREISERHRLEQEILEISEREQQRIGRDLHDDLGQRLVAISYMSQVTADRLAAASSPEAGSAAEITGLLNKALALTRSLARGLHPVAIESGGLPSALAELAERTSGIFEIPCRFSAPSRPSDLDQTCATHLYRIAREAVTNSVHHGKPTGIHIHLEHQPDGTTLAISDNGSGMPPLDPDRDGMGIRIMHYRTHVIGARLEFSAPPEGNGTLVTCRVPRTTT